MGDVLDRLDRETRTFHEMAEALRLGMSFQILVSPDGRGRRFTHLGGLCREMTGYDPADGLADGTLLYAQVLPEHQEALAQAEAAAIAARRRFELEVKMIGPRGDVRWRRIASTPTVRPDGSTLWDGLLTDVTDARRAEEALREQSRHLEAAVDATGLGIWEWDVPTSALIWSERMYGLHGLPVGKPMRIQDYADLVHEEDRERLRAAVLRARETPDDADFVVEYRTAAPLHHGKARWLEVQGRVVRDDGGVRLVVGTVLDISKRKAAEERRALLLGELAHRAKNGLQVMMGIVGQTARGVSSVKEFEEVLQARLKSMADSQDLVTASGGRPVLLRDVVATTLTPFDLSRFDGVSALPDITIAGDVAVTLGLLLHELATNAVKYGALSRRGGRVALALPQVVKSAVVVSWTESGGPEVRLGERRGFGSRLLQVALVQQGGKVEADYAPQGLTAKITFPSESVLEHSVR